MGCGLALRVRVCTFPTIPPPRLSACPKINHAPATTATDDDRARGAAAEGRV